MAWKALTPSKNPVCVRWLDSCVLHDQVDDDDLPAPSELLTVGWLSFDGPNHVVISRDHSPSPDSYSWRSSVAIPRAHISELVFLRNANGPETD